MENRHRIWIIVIIVFSFNFLTVNELTAERQCIAKAAKLNQHIYFKGILILKFVSKDLLLWKSSSFVSTEDENLWIASRLLWFHQTRPPENSGLWIKMIQFQEPIRLPMSLTQQEVVMENYAQIPKILFFIING